MLPPSTDYLKAELQKLWDAGVRRVIRREIDDARTCPHCRAINGKEYDIKRLLKLDYPLIQNPETGEYYGCTQCRGYFQPIVDFTEIEELVAKDANIIYASNESTETAKDVLKTEGKRIWNTLSKDIHDVVQYFYDLKIAESKMRLDKDGVEIIGEPTGGKAIGFITPAASQDAMNYFAESYDLYKKAGFQLEFLDPSMYKLLNEYVFKGKDFES